MLYRDNPVLQSFSSDKLFLWLWLQHTWLWLVHKQDGWELFIFHLQTRMSTDSVKVAAFTSRSRHIVRSKSTTLHRAQLPHVPTQPRNRTTIAIRSSTVNPYSVGHQNIFTSLLLSLKYTHIQTSGAHTFDHIVRPFVSDGCPHNMTPWSEHDRVSCS